MLYQQGDVVLKKVSEIRGERLGHLILAKGEATGHCHKVTKGDAELYEAEDGLLYLRVISDDVEISHAEHKSITLPKGDWKVTRVREYDHFAEEARPVRD